MKTKLLIILSLITAVSAYAGSATWKLNPGSNEWNTTTNWRPATVPNATTDTATFGASNTTGVSSSVHLDLSDLVFTADAPSYAITIATTTSMSFWGDGVRNDSGVEQTFTGGFGFRGNASAGDDVTYNATRGLGFHDNASAGSASFYMTSSFSFEDNSSAADATIVAVSSTGESCFFGGTSSAGNAHITLMGGDVEHSTAGSYLFIYSGTILDHGTFIAEPATVAGGKGATIDIEAFGFALSGGTFIVNGSAIAGAGGGTILIESNPGVDAGSFVINGAATPDGSVGEMMFLNVAGAGSSLITINGGENGGAGGKVTFQDASSGGTARVAAYGNGLLNLHLGVASATIGSIEGDGLVGLGSKNLTIGSNNLSTTFTGTIQEHGSVTKIGTGTLKLTGANTYSGGTTITSGVLLVSNGSGSGTGTGAVTVNGGTLGGSGIISGAVTVGTGAFLTPATGTNKQVTLSLLSNLTLQTGAAYTYGFKARINQSRTDLLVANGATVTGATITLKGKTQGTLTPGTVLTVISNTSANPIIGTFSNLADGAIVTVNGNKLQASYSGGDGNDLTLTVVP